MPRVSIYIFTTPKIINPGGNKLRDRESRVERYSRIMWVTCETVLKDNKGVTYWTVLQTIKRESRLKRYSRTMKGSHVLNGTPNNNQTTVCFVLNATHQQWAYSSCHKSGMSQLLVDVEIVISFFAENVSVHVYILLVLARLIIGRTLEVLVSVR